MKRILLSLLLLIPAAQGFAQTCNNLVVNGDFEAGGNTPANFGFTSNYGYLAPSPNVLTPEGKYTLANNPHAVHNGFANGTDHTSGTGRSMIVNGSTAANTVVWEETISVTSNTTYYFSTWAENVVDGNDAILQFTINGVQIGSNFSPTGLSQWQRFFAPWNSGSNTTAVIRLVDQQHAAGGNDFAIDDVFFTDAAPLVIAGTTPATASCAGAADGSIAVTAGGGVGPFQYSVNGGAFIPAAGNPFTITGLNPGSYSIVIKDACGSLSPAATGISVGAVDHTPPVLSGVPAAASVSCDAVPGAANVTASDNCSGTVPVTYHEITTTGTLPGSGLKGMWPFNEGSGTTTADQSGYGNNGTLTSGVSWTPGQMGSAVTFPGTGNEYVEIPNGTGGVLDTRYSLTMFAWFVPGTNGLHEMPIVQYNPNAWGSHLWQTGANQLFVRFTHRNTLAFTTELTANVLVPNQWNAVAATYDYNTGMARLYCNGVQVASLFIGTMELSTNYPVRVGSINSDARRTNGKVDNVAIYDRALSAAEIAAMSATQNCPQNYNLTRIWTAADASGNVATASQAIAVHDNTAPVLTVPTDMVVDADNGQCGAVVTFAASATDNCGTPTITYSKASGTSFDVGTTTVSVTAKDPCGNTTNGSFKVTVKDNEKPVVHCQNMTVTLSGGSASVTANDIDLGSTDNCAIDTRTVSPSSFNCSNVGPNTVTLTVTDIHNNSNTCTSTVTVVGEVPSCSISVAPSSSVYTGGIPTNIYLGYGPQRDTIHVHPSGGSTYTYSWTGHTAYLSCPDCANPVFTPMSPGTYVYTVLVTNNYGCTTTCSVTFCVKDIRVPGNGNNDKVYLCHVPPGNPANPNTLSISVNAVAAHLSNHSGDKLGMCDQTCGGVVSRTVPGSGFVVGDDVKVYPNPNSGSFTVELPYIQDQARIQVTDVAGKTIYSRVVKDGDGNKLLLNLGDISRGMYLVEVAYGDQRFRTKLIIQ